MQNAEGFPATIRSRGHMLLMDSISIPSIQPGIQGKDCGVARSHMGVISRSISVARVYSNWKAVYCAPFCVGPVYTESSVAVVCPEIWAVILNTSCQPLMRINQFCTEIALPNYSTG